MSTQTIWEIWNIHMTNLWQHTEVIRSCALSFAVTSPLHTGILLIIVLTSVKTSKKHEFYGVFGFATNQKLLWCVSRIDVSVQLIHLCDTKTILFRETLVLCISHPKSLSAPITNNNVEWRSWETASDLGNSQTNHPSCKHFN